MSQKEKNQPMDKIIKKIEKIEDILETISHEIDNLQITDYEELDKFEEVYDYAVGLYKAVLKVNEKIFNKYWGVRENMVVGVAPTDLSEDAEDRYVRFFVEFVDNLEAYNVEQLYNYIKENYSEDNSE